MIGFNALVRAYHALDALRHEGAAVTESLALVERRMREDYPGEYEAWRAGQHTVSPQPGSLGARTS
jgi:hypothetical protein